MNSIISIARLGVLAVVALLAGRTLAADADTTEYRYGELDKEQRIFSSYITDGNNEYRSATNRCGQKLYTLAENNILIALIRVDTTLKKMEGHPQRVAQLRSFFLLRTRVKTLTDKYLKLRNDAYELQNTINKFIVDLRKRVPGGLKLVDEYLKNKNSIYNDPNYEKKMESVVQKLRDAVDAGNSVTPGIFGGTGAGGADSLPPGFRADASGKIVGPDGYWIDEQGNLRGANGENFGDYKQYIQNGKFVPPAKSAWPAGFRDDGTGKITGPGGYWIDEQGNLRGPDGKNYGNYRQFIRDGKFVPPTAGLTVDGGPAPRSTSTFIGADGKRIVVETDWFDAEGRMKPYKIKITYSDVKGGQINSEQQIVREAKTTDKADTFLFVEREGEKTNWALRIEEVEGTKQASRATYRLVNDDTDKAEFVIDKWEIVNSSGQVKSGPGSQFDVVFPAPGEYTIKAYGKTKKWSSSFVITTPANSIGSEK